MENENQNPAEQNEQTEQPQDMPEQNPPQDQPQDNPEPDQQDQPQDEPKSEPKDERSPVEKVIDELDIGPENPKPDEKPAEKTGEEQPKPEPKEPPKEPKKPLTPEEEDAMLLAGVKSERGKARLQRLFAESRESRDQLQAVHNVIQRSGLDREGFANVLEICRLCSSKDPVEQENGLKALDAVRAEIYKAYGREAPGVDMLEGYDDLKKRVEDYSLKRNEAIEIANARRVIAERNAQVQVQNRAQQEAQETQRRLQSFGTMAMNAFKERANEVDFNAKIEAMQKYFSRPGAIQQFVATHRPEAWTSALLWMYDNVGVTHRPPEAPRPITQNRLRQTGKPAIPHPGTVEGIAARIEELGL